MSTKGIHHVGLTTPDIERTSQFFTDLLNFEIVNRNPDYPAVFVSDGTNLITLWQAQDKEGCVSFDRHKCVGLHHIAFKVETLSELNDMHKKLSDHDISIEFGPESVGDSSSYHMMFSEPCGIRIELFTDNKEL